MMRSWQVIGQAQFFPLRWAQRSDHNSLPEAPMPHFSSPFAVRSVVRSLLTKPTLAIVTILIVAPLAAHAQGSPFDTGFSSLQTLFTGTVAKVASLIAIVIGGYAFAHGEPGAKKTLAGVAAGTGIAVMAANVLSWLWGV
jgi:type IV secretory pathway VirB2 component (pilin)